MKHLLDSGKFLLLDLASTFVFAAVFALTGNVWLTLVAAVGVGLAGIGWDLRKRRPIDLMQWLSLGLVAAMGGAALLAHDSRFIMLKPSLVYLAVAAVMLRRGWMNRYLPPIVTRTAPELGVAFGYAWAALMAATAAANLAFALQGDTRAWAWFIGVVPLTSKAILFLVQYAVIRTTVGRRLERATISPAPAFDDASPVLDRWNPASLVLAGESTPFRA